MGGLMLLVRTVAMISALISTEVVSFLSRLLMFLWWQRFKREMHWKVLVGLGISVLRRRPVVCMLIFTPLLAGFCTPVVMMT